jgi:hypothetical protein
MKQDGGRRDEAIVMKNERVKGNEPLARDPVVLVDHAHARIDDVVAAVDGVVDQSRNMFRFKGVIIIQESNVIAAGVEQPTVRGRRSAQGTGRIDESLAMPPEGSLNRGMAAPFCIDDYDLEIIVSLISERL